jgi:hypothetical protein
LPDASRLIQSGSSSGCSVVVFADILSGVIVVAEQATANDLVSLNNRKLPFLLIGSTNLHGPCIPLEPGIKPDDLTYFQYGQRAAEALTRAFLTGNRCTSPQTLATTLRGLDPPTA